MIKKLLIAGGLAALLGGCNKPEQANANGYTCKRDHGGTVTSIHKGDQEMIMATYSDEVNIYYIKNMSLHEVVKAVKGCKKIFERVRFE